MQHFWLTSKMEFHTCPALAEDLVLTSPKTASDIQREETSFVSMKTTDRKYSFSLQIAFKKITGISHILHPYLFSPTEEKLYEMRWKDNFYFYGDPDTYLTQLSLKNGKEASNLMNSFRGKDSVEDSLAVIPVAAISPDEVENPEDVEFNAHHSCNRSLEDMYLPRHVPDLLKTLPQLLLRDGAAIGRLYTGIELGVDESIQRHKSEKMKLFLSCASNIVAETCDRINSQYRRGFADSREISHLVLELLPTLRRIGLYEQAAEFAAFEMGKDAAIETTRRTSRRLAKARRHHYFDKLSSMLRGDYSDLNSSELGALMSKDSLVYSGL